MHTEAANAQHYELPPAFFALCLGPRRKYSCCYFPSGGESLAEAEEAMLELDGRRAELADGQRILELSCGWGSLTLWMAERFPHARITALSNSHNQRRHIEAQCRARALTNVRVLTHDVNSLILDAAHFDRCISIEMFEHVRNYETLMQHIAGWLKPGGKLFAHLFAHRTLMYPFETTGADNWMGRQFFTGGLMPAVDTLLHFQAELAVERRWLIDGTHYRRTAELWLARQDAQRPQVLAVLGEPYGGERPAVVRALAAILDGLRGAVRLRRRLAVGDRPLPLQACGSRSTGMRAAHTAVALLGALGLPAGRARRVGALRGPLVRDRRDSDPHRAR